MPISNKSGSVNTSLSVPKMGHKTASPIPAQLAAFKEEIKSNDKNTGYSSYSGSNRSGSLGPAEGNGHPGAHQS